MTQSPTTHPVHLLIERLASFGAYPDGWSEVRQRIRGTAFFPGGHGLWDPKGNLPPLPPRPIVIVGHNWGIPKHHCAAVAAGIVYSEDWSKQERNGNATWWQLLPILRGAGVKPENCFFTNAFMGLKDDGGSNVGATFTTPDFDLRCREFLRFQLRILRPSVVVAMGHPAIRMLYDLSPHDLRVWRGPRGGERTILEIYERDGGIVSPVSFDEQVLTCVTVALNHTCDQRNLSSHSVREIELVRAAVALAPNTAFR